MNERANQDRKQMGRKERSEQEKDVNYYKEFLILLSYIHNVMSDNYNG